LLSRFYTGHLRFALNQQNIYFAAKGITITFRLTYVNYNNIFDVNNEIFLHSTPYPGVYHGIADIPRPGDILPGMGGQTFFPIGGRFHCAQRRLQRLCPGIDAGQFARAAPARTPPFDRGSLPAIRRLHRHGFGLAAGKQGN
jgi:hypothetical protein